MFMVNKLRSISVVPYILIHLILAMRRCINNEIVCLCQRRRELFEYTVFIYFAWRACSSWSLLHAGLDVRHSSYPGVPKASTRLLKGNCAHIIYRFPIHTLSQSLFTNVWCNIHIRKFIYSVVTVA